MHKNILHRGRESIRRSPRIYSGKKRSTSDTPHIHIQQKEERKRSSEPWKGREGKQELVHLRRCIECVQHPGFASSPFVERNAAAAAATGPACYYLIFIHSAHCFWITGCPPLHSSSLIFTRGRPSVIYFGTEIRFANHRAAHCAPRGKADFIVIFTFTSRATPSRQRQCIGAFARTIFFQRGSARKS